MLKHTIEEIVLSNGSRGLFIDVPGASVMNFRVDFRAGDVYTSSHEKWETAHIMEHLSLGANQRYRSARNYQAELEKNGAYSIASTGPIEMIYEAECADFEWDRIADLFLHGISKPLFLESEFKAECGNVYEELMARGNNQGNRLYFEMCKLYGLNTKSMQDRVALMHNVTLEDIKEHYQRTHFPQNMRFIIAGKMQGRKTKLKELLASMPLPQSSQDTDRFQVPLETPECFVEPLYIKNDSIPNSYFYIDTYRLSELNETELHALGLLGTILCDTLYSKILGEAREKGLIYYLSNNYSRSPNYSSWWFGSEVSQRQLLPFLKVFVREFDKVRRGNLKNSDIEQAKLYQIGGHQRSAQTVRSLTNGYGGLYFYNGQIDDYYTRFPDKIRKITKEHVIASANSMFKEKIWGVGFLGTLSDTSIKRANKVLAPLWE